MTIESIQPLHFEQAPKGPSPSGVSSIATLALQLFEHKEKAKEAELKNTFNRFNPSIIGGDILTVATLVLSLIATLSSGFGNLEAVIYATTACGIAAGIINLSVGCIEGKQAAQCFINNKETGKSLQGKRYAIDCATMNTLGLVMILTALSSVVPGLHSLNNFFSTHQYILPSAFFLASLPVIFEAGRRVKNIHTHTDLASQLDLETLQKMLDEHDIDEASKFFMEKLKVTENPSPQDLRCSLETLQEEMGVEAAIPVFKLLHALLLKEEETAKQYLTVAKVESDEWNKIQKTRLFQQMLYIAAFVLSMTILIPGIGCHDIFHMTISDTSMMLLANIIPLAIDILHPFKRNPHIVVPGIPDEELLNSQPSANTDLPLQLEPHDSMSEETQKEASVLLDLVVQQEPHLGAHDLQPS